MGHNRELLKNVAIFSHVSEGTLAKLEQLVVTKRYPRESMIVSQDETGDSLYVLAEGRVKVVLMSGESGREMILSVFKPGDFFGEMSLIDGQPRSASVVAMEDSTLLVLHRADFRRYLADNPDAAFGVMTELCTRIRKADEIIGNLALLDVHGRVAHMLLDLAKSDGEQVVEGTLIRDRPTQQNIASMVGTSRETVSRALSEFAKRGYIELRGKDILIKRGPALEAEYMTR